MASLPDLTARLRVDTSDLSKAERATSRFGANLGTAVRAGSVAAAAGLALVGKASIAAASNLEQSMGAVDSVFGAAADKVKAFGEQAADSVGLAKSEYATLAAVIGSQMQRFGQSQDEAAISTDKLIKLGADLAATYGGSVNEAVSALGSLLRGERDPIERYAVGINDAAIKAHLAAKGLDGLTGAALDQAKAQATLELLYQQTAKAQGAFGRESDTLAGQQARLKAELTNISAELGTRLLPVLTSLAEKGNRALDWVSNNPGLVNGAIQLGKIAATLVVINKTLSVSKAIRASELLTTLAQVRASQTLLATETARARLGGGGVDVGVPGLPGGRHRAAARRFRLSTVGNLGGPHLLAIGAAYGAADFGRDSLNRVMNDRRVADESGDNADQARAAIIRARQFMGDAGFAKQYQQAVKPLIQAGQYVEATQAINELVRGFLNLTPAQKAAAAAQAELSKAQAGSGPITQAQAEAYRSLRSSLFGAFDAFGEKAAPKPLSSKELLKRLGINTASAKQMALDIEDLIQAGVSLPAIEKLRELESTAPGTIRGIVQNGITKPWIDEVNSNLASAKYDASVIASLVTTGSRAALPAASAGAQMARRVTSAFDTELRAFVPPPITIKVSAEEAFRSLERDFRNFNPTVSVGTRRTQDGVARPRQPAAAPSVASVNAKLAAGARGGV